MHKLCNTCADLGVPVATAKTVGPTTCLTLSGFEVDTDLLELCLPQEELQRVKQMVQEWMRYNTARRRELQSLLGLLQHAAKVVSPERRFMRTIIQELTSIKEHDHYMRLRAEIQPCMVAQIFQQVKWSRHPPNPRDEVSSHPVGCIRIMGLCSGLG